MTFNGDTVAAIATAPGRGGVAVVRVSGPEAWTVAQALTGKKPVAGKVTFSPFVDAQGRFLDEGIVLVFKGPHSYTGEDVVEFQCHGGTVTPRRVLEACFVAGARLAERGEFTARAFFNGRLPLDAAEGVIELVDAKTDRAADRALGRLKGECGQRHRALYDKALELSSSLEYTLDVDEGEMPSDYVEGLRKKVESLREEIVQAVTKLREGKILRDGACVVLAGAPNAGKSSLLNALLGEDRAIVSATPGTTRDTIEAWLNIEGWPIRLMDTAGLRRTTDAIEAEGVARANDLIGQADVVLALDCDIDGALRVHAKCDLDGDRPRPPLSVSAKTGEGLEELRQAIAAALEAKAQRIDEPTAGDGERETALLTEALGALKDLPDDIVLLANHVRTCADTLGRLVGAVYSDDLLDTLFSRFCVGK